MTNKAFDHLIKNKLEGIDPPFNPDHWQRMDKQLSGDTSASSESTVDPAIVFDQIIASSLDSNSSNTPPNGAWDLFESKLNGGESSDSDTSTNNPAFLDQIVYDNLKNKSVSYSSKSWGPIEVRLDQMIAIQQNYYNLKVIEAAIFLLLLVGFIHLFPDQHTVDSNREIPMNSTNELVIPAEKEMDNDRGPIALESNNPETEREAHPFLTTSEVERNSSIAANESPSSLNKNSVLLHNDNKEQVYKNRPANGNNVIGLGENLTNNSLIDYSIWRKQLSVTPIPSGNLNLSVESSITQNPIDALIDQSSSSNLQSEEVYKIMPLALRQSTVEYSNKILGNIDARIKQIKSKAVLRGGMVGSVDFNRVYTPENIMEERYSESIRYALGYSSGFTLGFEKGRFEIETGALYSAKYYYPVWILFVSGSFEDEYSVEGLKFFELDMINLPLNFRYNYYSKNRWRAYAMMGGSLQIAYQTHYYTAKGEDFPNVIGLPSQQPTSSGGTNNRPSLVDENKDIFGGWLEGGPFEDNSYFTLNAGLGMEKYFSSRFSFFVQASYQHPINIRGPIRLGKNIGPDNETIGTTSLGFGIRARITN